MLVWLCVCVSGLSLTVSLWRSLFMLLQDEDQEVRGSASDFMSVPSPLVSEGAHSLPGELEQIYTNLNMMLKKLKILLIEYKTNQNS